MKIQIASDLHLEFPENKQWLKENSLVPVGDILLLAGDIVPSKYRQEAEDFYAQVEQDFPHIISAMGNHEFYHGDSSYVYPSYTRKISPHHVQINNQVVIIDNVKFVVSVLWSHVPAKKRFANRKFHE